MCFRGGISPWTLYNRVERPKTALIHKPFQCGYLTFVSVIWRSSGVDVLDCVSSWDELGWNRLLSGLKAKRYRSRETSSIPSS